MQGTRFQILVLPFRHTPEGIHYAVFQRRDAGYWQGVAGGNKNGETSLQTAQRETFEETGVRPEAPFLALDTIASIPVVHFRDHEKWDPDMHVITEYSFGVELQTETLHLSEEHIRYQWLPYSEAHKVLQFDSNRTALWELNRRLSGSGTGSAHSTV